MGSRFPRRKGDELAWGNADNGRSGAQGASSFFTPQNAKDNMYNVYNSQGLNSNRDARGPPGFGQDPSHLWDSRLSFNDQGLTRHNFQQNYTPLAFSPQGTFNSGNGYGADHVVDQRNGNFSYGSNCFGLVYDDEKRNSGPGVTNNTEGTVPRTSTPSTVIKPIIENIVGSMSACNGTYSPFGPVIGSETATVPDLLMQNHFNSGGPNEVISALNPPSNNKPSNSATMVYSGNEAKDDRKFEIPSAEPGNRSTPNGMISQENSALLTEHASRPQTPAKPSYVEILTKNVNKVSTSPVHAYEGGSSRKANDGFINANFMMGSNSSSCSSSPVPKPKISENKARAGRGKENVSNGNSSSGSNSSSKSSTSRNTPSNTPAKGKKPETTIWSDKKGAKSKKKAENLDRRSSFSFTQFSDPFQYDIEDMDDHNGNEDYDEKWVEETARPASKGVNSSNANANVNSYNLNKSGSSCRYFEETLLRYGTKEDKKTFSSNSNNCNGSVGNAYSAPSQSSAQTTSRKSKSRKREHQNVYICRAKAVTKIWLTHMISALTWLWSLVVDVTILSASLGCSLFQDFKNWWDNQAVPYCRNKFDSSRASVASVWYKFKDWTWSFRRKTSDSNTKNQETHEVIKVMGPERNINLPTSGDEALKRLLGTKGQDPYSILGVRSDSSDDVVRRYYKKQAVLVHPDKNLVPGAEEAFKILGRAFELVGDPIKRAEYHQKIMEAHAKEKVAGEIGVLLEQLRKKMEAVSSSIRCTKCDSRHKKNRINRPVFAARYCSQCQIHHQVREGDLWAEKKGFFGITWHYFACMENQVWEINEWARCQKTNLKQIRADSHVVMYRLIAGGGDKENSKATPPAHQHSKGSSSRRQQQPMEFHSNLDNWDSWINNLYRGSPMGNGPNHQQPGSSCCSNENSAPSSSAKKRKGRRK